MELSNHDLRTIARCPNLSQLEHLNVGQWLSHTNDGGAAAADILSSTPILANLKRLVLDARRFTSANIIFLTGISATSLESVLSSSRLESVTSLTIGYVIGQSLKEVVSCRSLHRLKELHLNHVGLMSEDDVMAALSSSEYRLTRMKSLSISGSSDGQQYPFLRYVARWPHFSSLVSLSFNELSIGGDELAVLCSSVEHYYWAKRMARSCQLPKFDIPRVEKEYRVGPR